AGEVLDRRVGQRDDLAIVAEAIHLAEAFVEIEQLRHAAQARTDIAEPRCDAIHLLEERIREDVAVDIDDGVAGHAECPCAGFSVLPSHRSQALAGGGYPAA